MKPKDTQLMELHSLKRSGLQRTEEQNFSSLLVGLFRSIRGQRRSVPLVELQAALFARGWHL